MLAVAVRLEVSARNDCASAIYNSLASSPATIEGIEAGRAFDYTQVNNGGVGNSIELIVGRLFLGIVNPSGRVGAQATYVSVDH